MDLTIGEVELLRYALIATISAEKIVDPAATDDEVGDAENENSMARDDFNVMRKRVDTDALIKKLGG